MKALLTLAMLAVGMGLSAPAMAISPEEVMADPRLEQRARDISKQLRCLVCQNQSIDDSDAPLAQDLRREVRLQLRYGMSDEAIFDHLRAKFGDYVLLKPPVTPATYALWGLPVALVLIGGLAFVMTRRNTAPPTTAPLTTSSPIADMPPQDALNEDMGGAPPPAVIWGSMAIVLAVSLGLYALLGRPELTAQPLAERQDQILAAKQQQAKDNAKNTERLNSARAAADANPSSVEAQLTYAMVAAQAGAYGDERQGIARALELTDRDPSIVALMAEAISRDSGGMVTLPARKLVAETLAKKPAEPRALYLSGLAAYQDEDFPKAITIWQGLLAALAEDDPLSPVLARNIRSAAESGGLPLSDELERVLMAAETTPDEQAAMITAMVEGLEERLADTPDDPEGWSRLIQSRQVLNDEDGLMRAAFGAAAALREDASAQVRALTIMLERNTDRQYLAEAADVLARLRMINPDSLELLFFDGHFAVLQGQNDRAIDQWSRFLDALPEDAPIRDDMIAQINALKQQD